MLLTLRTFIEQDSKSQKVKKKGGKCLICIIKNEKKEMLDVLIQKEKKQMLKTFKSKQNEKKEM
jgi:hypothetical protein